jgi:error-prone DNA polymerase
MGYAELHCLSNFSFLRGASHPEELVERAAELGYTALAVTDECSVAGVVRAHGAAREHGLKLLIGSELRIDDGPRLVLLACNRRGYGQLCRLITRGRRAAGKGSYRLVRADFGAACRWWRRATCTCTCASAARCRTCSPRSASACRYSTPAAALHPNGERHLRRCRGLAQLYPQALLAETLAIAARCTLLARRAALRVPARDWCPRRDASHLRELTEEGAAQRFPAARPTRCAGRSSTSSRSSPSSATSLLPHRARHRALRPLARHPLPGARLGGQLGGVLLPRHHRGRPGAHVEMLFERFISRERNEPPDIDVDFEHERREEVIQYLYAKYGRDRAALAATVISYRPRSALRDVGKALGLDPPQVDRLAKSMRGGTPLADRRAPARGGLRSGEPGARCARAGPRAARLPAPPLAARRRLRHRARPALALVPVENAAMPERTVIQWDKDDLDALGLLKVDVLGSACSPRSAARSTW